MGTLQRLPSIVGHGVAMDLALTARTITGAGRRRRDACRAAGEACLQRCCAPLPTHLEAWEAQATRASRDASTPSVPRRRSLGDSLCPPSRRLLLNLKRRARLLGCPAGAEARELHVVSRTFPTQQALMAGAAALARSIAAKSPLAVVGTKRVLLHQR